MEEASVGWHVEGTAAVLPLFVPVLQLLGSASHLRAIVLELAAIVLFPEFPCTTAEYRVAKNAVVELVYLKKPRVICMRVLSCQSLQAILKVASNAR